MKNFGRNGVIASMQPVHQTSDRLMAEARLGPNRLAGAYAYSYWAAVVLNFLPLQFLWFARVRRQPAVLFFIALSVTAGMWYERFVIIGTSLAQDFLPSSWGHYTPSWVEVFTFIGTFGMFITLFLLFMRFLPMICIFEVKGVTPAADPHHHPHHPHGTPQGPDALASTGHDTAATTFAKPSEAAAH